MATFHKELATLDIAVHFTPEKLMEFDVPKPRLRPVNGDHRLAA